MRDMRVPQSLPTVLLCLAAIATPACQENTSVDDVPASTPAPSTDPSVELGVFQLSTSQPPVVDGDTIRVDGLRPSLRLIGIDTEETFRDDARRALASRNWDEYLKTMNAGSTSDRPPKYATPMGEAAKRFAQEFFSDVTAVRLEYDDPSRKLGYFERHLVHVLVERDHGLINYNVEVVRQGYSPYFKKYGRSARYHGAFLAAEAEARARGRGIWADPPPFHRYPDYVARIAWWNERDHAFQRLTRLKQVMGPELVILGEDAEWERLKKMSGRKVTVAGSPGQFRETGTRGIQYIGHRKNNDFAIVGPVNDFEGHAIRSHPGDIILISGVVSLYRGRPQFMLDTIAISKP